MVRKNILKIIFGLISANRKLFLKNLTLPSLFNIEKIKITILEVFKVISSIFWAPTFIFHIMKLSWKAKSWIIILTLLFEFNRAFIFAWSLKVIEYQMQSIYSILFYFSVNNMEVVKTITSFFTFENICWYSGSFVYKYNTWYSSSP